MSVSGAEAQAPRAAFERALGELRPKQHRYCARMTGSVIDGEDVVQDALMKAIDAFAGAGSIVDLDGWLFRIAHNAALDFLRRRRRLAALQADEELDTMAALTNPVAERQAAAASLRTFMRLPVAQRSCVILMDVLGYGLEEIGEVTGASVPSVKASLNRGRRRLREIADEPEDAPIPALAEPQRRLLAHYVDRFNARDFDAVRDMLAQEVRLELVSRTRLNGKREVGRYFHNYAGVDDWQLWPGWVDGRPALLVRDPRNASAPPRYFILLEWAGEKLIAIRDFRHADYAIEGAEIVVAG